MNNKSPNSLAILSLTALLSGTCALRAADVTYERLLHPEPQNWLMNHHDFGSQRFSPLDHDQQVERQEPQARLRGAARRPLRQRICRGDAAGRGRLDVHHRRVGRRLQDRRALRHRRAHPVEDGPGPAEARPQPRRRAVGQPGHLGRRPRRPASSPPTRKAARSSGTRSSATSPTSSSPPRRWRSKDSIVIGASGGDNGVRDWLAGLDPKTGDTQWKTFMVPAPGEPGSETWKDKTEAWRTGGGALYVTGSYDPADQPHLLGNRQSGAALQFRLPAGRATICSPKARSRSMPPPARCSGISSSARTTTATTTPKRLADHRRRQGQWRGPQADRSMPTATASTIRSTGSTASFSNRRNIHPQGHLDQGHRSQERQASRLRSGQGRADLCVRLEGRRRRDEERLPGRAWRHQFLAAILQSVDQVALYRRQRRLRRHHAGPDRARARQVRRRRLCQRRSHHQRA